MKTSEKLRNLQAELEELKRLKTLTTNEWVIQDLDQMIEMVEDNIASEEDRLTDEP